LRGGTTKQSFDDYAKFKRLPRLQSSLLMTGFYLEQLYFGYKLHAVCSIDGVFQTFDLSAASVHDIHYLNDVSSQFSHCVLIGDRGYLSQTYQLDLFEQCSIDLQTPIQRNQIHYQPCLLCIRS
jgi:hypothetical protein